MENCGWGRRPPDMDGGCKYNEYIVTDSRHGGHPAWRLGRATIPYHKKASISWNVPQGTELGSSLAQGSFKWQALMNTVINFQAP